MSKLRLLIVSMMILILVVTAACGDNAGTNRSQGDSRASSDSSSSVPAAETQMEAGPFVKYDPPITVRTARATNANVKFKSGESYEKNNWTVAYERDLGIKIEYDWIVNDDQYDQKLNVSIASKDLPDIFKVNATQLRQLIEADMLEDLTPYYEAYASDALYENIEREPNAKAAAMYDGKLYAIPPGGFYPGKVQFLWVRTDWLEKLNLPEPKTMDDVFRIAEAFATQDPDGNGKDDTFGLAMSKELWSGYPSITGFLNGFHAYHGIWLEDGEGGLVYSSIQPEMKQALAKLQEMYKKGWIDPEFGVKDGTKAQELAVAGRVGMNYGADWNAIAPFTDNVLNDPEADWKPFPIVSIDDREAKPQS